MTDNERDAQTISEALNAGFEYWGHELDDVTGRVHALSPEAKLFEVAFAALARLVAALSAATTERDAARAELAAAYGDTTSEWYTALDRERERAEALAAQLSRQLPRT